MPREDTPAFSISPNPSALYLTPPLIGGLAKIRRAIQRKQGLGMILGDVGLGKSSLLRLLALDYQTDQERYTVSYLHDSRKIKTPFDFLKIIGEDFKVDAKRSQRAQMDAIEEYLFTNANSGINTVVFIDEAQRLSLEILELVRSLLNFETHTQKLVQFVMAGQLELRDRLLERRYLMVRDRIVAPLLMEPLNLNETRHMIRTRLEHWEMEDPFTSEAVEQIYQFSKGVPRRVLLLCQQACDLVPDTQKINDHHIADAYQQLQITAPQELTAVAAV
jgi:general secretion pathway protein A